MQIECLGESCRDSSECEPALLRGLRVDHRSGGQHSVRLDRTQTPPAVGVGLPRYVRQYAVDPNRRDASLSQADEPVESFREIHANLAHATPSSHGAGKAYTRTRSANVLASKRQVATSERAQDESLRSFLYRMDVVLSVVLWALRQIALCTLLAMACLKQIQRLSSRIARARLKAEGLFVERACIGDPIQQAVG